MTGQGRGAAVVSLRAWLCGDRRDNPAANRRQPDRNPGQIQRV